MYRVSPSLYLTAERPLYSVGANTESRTQHEEIFFIEVARGLHSRRRTTSLNFRPAAG